MIALRDDAQVAPTGDGRAVAYGGRAVDGDDYQVFRDGAIVDLATRRSTPLPLAPAPALGHLAVAVSGRSLLVAGTECTDGTVVKMDDHGASPPCPEARVGIRRLDLGTSKWDVDATVPSDLLGAATQAAAIGQTGSTIVVLAYFDDGSRERAAVLTYDVNTKEWARAPRRDLGRACWAGGAMVSLTRSELASWRPGSGSWKATSLPVSLGASEKPYLLCTDNYAVVHDWPPGGRSGRLAAFAPATGRWSDLPSKPDRVPGVWSVSVGDRLALWNDTAPAPADLDLHVLDVGVPDRGWVDVGKPPKDRFALIERVAA